MRIAYVCHWNLDRRDGVSAKIASQVAHWEREGHEVVLCCLSPRTDAAADAPSLPAEPFLFGNAFERVVETRSLFRTVEQLAPALVYLRYDAFAPPPTRLMRRLPTIVEINSDDVAELRMRRPAPRVYNRVQRTGLLRAAAGAVFVTHELARASSFRRLGGPRTVIANGIDENAVVGGSPPANRRPRAVFLGSPVPWQGVDKLLWLAAALPEVDFDLVGVPPAVPLPSNVRCHGFLPESDYVGLVAQADVGIGPLALHRKDMSEACPLKVRTYLARGVPVLLGHEDTDFLGENPWFLLRLPNHERNVRDGLERIRAFLAEVSGRRVDADAVRTRIGAQTKERERLRFFEHVLERTRAGVPR